MRRLRRWSKRTRRVGRDGRRRRSGQRAVQLNSIGLVDGGEEGTAGYCECYVSTEESEVKVLTYSATLMNVYARLHRMQSPDFGPNALVKTEDDDSRSEVGVAASDCLSRQSASCVIIR